MTEKSIAVVVFSGDLNPDVDAAMAALRQGGFTKFARLHPPVAHELDAFLEVEFDKPTSREDEDAIWNKIDEIVDPYEGMVMEVQNCISHLRLVT